MPRYNIELRRVRPGNDRKITVEHANHEVEAADQEDARAQGLDALKAGNRDIQWTQAAEGTMSGEGVGYVSAVQAMGPKSATTGRRHPSPVARAIQDIPTKTIGGAVARSQDDNTQIKLDEGLASQRDPKHPNYELHEGDEPHPDDTPAWQEQQKRNAQAANPS